MKNFTHEEIDTIDTCNMSDHLSFTDSSTRNFLAKTFASKKNGVLLYGGNTAKAEIMQRISAEMGAVLVTIALNDLNMRDRLHVVESFSNAFTTAKVFMPGIIFIEDIDLLLDAKRSDPELASFLIRKIRNARLEGIYVAACTNHIDLIDAAAVREGIFDMKFHIPSEVDLFLA
jgi:transitional endoplasmic reticulum ATPase